MKLGKLQKAWIENLRKYPERQTINILGEKVGNSYKACCLGELLITSCRLKSKRFPFNDKGELVDGTNAFSDSILHKSYSSFGLKDRQGSFNPGAFFGGVKIKGYVKHFASLANMNDNGVTWLEIADFVESNPSLVFDKSV